MKTKVQEATTELKNRIIFTLNRKFIGIAMRIDKGDVRAAGVAMKRMVSL
jgi:hypothetical protein